MEDITPRLEHYRECVRHLWNSGFRVLETPPDDTQDPWDRQEEFIDIATQLFRSFVLQPIGHPEADVPREDETNSEPFPFLQIIGTGERLSIIINRGQPATSYWDDPVNSVMRGDATLSLIGYFDFDVLGPRDLEYYLVRITGYEALPHLVGRDALVRVKDTRVLFANSASPDCR